MKTIRIIEVSSLRIGRATWGACVENVSARGTGCVDKNRLTRMYLKSIGLVSRPVSEL